MRFARTGVNETYNSSGCVVENIKLYKKLNSDRFSFNIPAHYTVLNKIVRYN